MPPTTDEVRREIDKDELDYPGLAETLGADALPALRALVLEDEPRIASKAAYLAGVIAGQQSADIVAQAAQSRHHSIRVAAAAVLPSLGGDATATAEQLLSDPDVGVRARAVKSAAALGDPALADKVQRIAESDAHDDVRDIAREATGRLRPR